jgi:hypothetical protein
MLRLLTTTAICGTLLLSITPAFAGKFGCNPAVQNWQNGSKDTCPYPASNSASQTKAPAFEYSPPEVVDEDPQDEPEDDTSF